MSTLVATTYDEPYQARDVRLTLLKLHDEYLFEREDAIAVNNRKGRIRLRRFVDPNAVGKGALYEGGFDGDFTTQIVKDLHPDSSVLFVLSSKASSEQLVDAIEPYGGTVRKTHLTLKDETKLRAAIDKARRTSKALINSLFFG